MEVPLVPHQDGHAVDDGGEEGDGLEVQGHGVRLGVGGPGVHPAVGLRYRTEMLSTIVEIKECKLLRNAIFFLTKSGMFFVVDFARQRIAYAVHCQIKMQWPSQDQT